MKNQALRNKLIKEASTIDVDADGFRKRLEKWMELNEKAAPECTAWHATSFGYTPVKSATFRIDTCV